MHDPDISAADALALLTRPDDDAAGLNRRRFLQMVGLGVGGGALLGSLGSGMLPSVVPGAAREAWAGAPLGPNEGVLILIGLYGGSDGMNTVVPYSNPLYNTYRSNISIPPDQLLLLDGEVGLHPNLPFLKSMWDTNELAVIQGVGYPDPNLSHFDSMATWMSGIAGGQSGTGWIGRWLDGLGAGADLFKAAVIGSGLPLHMLGNFARATTIPEWGFSYGGGSSANDQRLYSAVRAFSAGSAGRGPWHDAIAAAERDQLDVTQTIAPVFTPDPPEGVLIKKMTIAARLVNADIGMRVIDASLDNFDTHSDEPEEHAKRMTELNDGVQAFYAALNPAYRSRVTIMTFSEFGRTPWSNDSRGTDHGTANSHFVIGGNVKGGRYGRQPSLRAPDGSLLDQWERLEFNVDFRSMYATMIDGVLGGGSGVVLNGNFPTLDLIRVPSPAGGGGGVVGPIGPPSDFVGLVPARLLDTRDGEGAPMGLATTRTLQVSGAGGVPIGAIAAVLNVTAVEGTQASYLTVWPTGLPQPNTSSLNVAGGDTVPNLVITRISDAGQVNIYNNAGQVHCVVDVVGYFTADTASRFSSLTPSRILDTRNGTGAPPAALGQGSWIDVQVTGQGGVAGDADSVVMNVTVTEPTSIGYVTVWPTGAAMPTASNLNFVVGQTAPNLVIAKLGAGGQVSMYNSAGSSHLVADVLGYFRAASGARMTPLAPVRLLDTRYGGGGPVAQDPQVVPVVGRGGVPASGVSAVVLNVTATGGTSNGYVTVFPDGEDPPLASNLNVVAGATRANLVIAKLGADGAVALFNSSGEVHLIADVVGFFSD